MLIDWFTVAAQLLNFCILLVLLKKFLYTPLVAAMDKREKSIRDAEGAAEKAHAEAQQEKLRARAERADLEKKRQAFLAEAAQEAEKTRAELVEKARQDVEQSRQNWLHEAAREQDALLTRFRQEAGRHLLSMAGTVLSEISGEKLEPYILDLFFQKLQDHLEKRPFAGTPPYAPFTLVTGFAMEPELKKATTKRLVALVAGTPAFKVDSSLGPGVRIHVGHERFSWDLDHHMNEMERSLMTALSSSTGNSQ